MIGTHSNIFKPLASKPIKKTETATFVWNYLFIPTIVPFVTFQPIWYLRAYGSDLISLRAGMRFLRFIISKLHPRALRPMSGEIKQITIFRIPRKSENSIYKQVAHLMLDKRLIEWINDQDEYLSLRRDWIEHSNWWRPGHRSWVVYDSWGMHRRICNSCLADQLWDGFIHFFNVDWLGIVDCITICAIFWDQNSSVSGQTSNFFILQEKDKQWQPILLIFLYGLIASEI